LRGKQAFAFLQGAHERGVWIFIVSSRANNHAYDVVFFFSTEKEGKHKR
jgi:hypothetical protein